MDSSEQNSTSEREPLLRTASELATKPTNQSQKEQTTSNSTAQTSGFKPTPRKDLPPGTSLASLFRYHIGIDHDEMLVPPHLAKQSAIDPIATGQNHGRRAVNLGIYNRCIREERGTNLSYQIWSVVINGALACQVIFAAVLTALGAGDGPHQLVTVFGTLNTIIAGFLTYLKGTGLPMRMKYFHDQWLKLRAYIEQRERDFASDDLSQIHRISYDELMEEVDIVEKMYHNIRKDVERHTPDNFGGKKDNAEGPGEGAPEASLASKGLNAMKARFSKSGGGTKSFAQDLESRVGGRSARNRQRQSSASDGKPKSNGKAVDTATLDDLDEEHSETDDVSTVAMERARVLQQRTQAAEDQARAAQEKAEQRIKDLEAKLASMDKSKGQSESG